MQYGKFMQRVLTGDFGNSIRTGDPVTDVIGRAFPATIELAVAAMIIAVGLGMPLGYLAARHRGRLLDNLTIGGTLLGISIPIFFLGYLLKDVFTQDIALVPAVRADQHRAGQHQRHRLLRAGRPARPGSSTPAGTRSWHLVLPAITLATIPLAVIVRITRASVLDVLNEDYVRTAEAKGLRHAHHPGPARAAQRPAAGGHHHRSADRRAAGRRGAHREGLQLGRPRHPDRRLDQRRPGLSACCRR